MKRNLELMRKKIILKSREIANKSEKLVFTVLSVVTKNQKVQLLLLPLCCFYCCHHSDSLAPWLPLPNFGHFTPHSNATTIPVDYFLKLVSLSCCHDFTVADCCFCCARSAVVNTASIRPQFTLLTFIALYCCAVANCNG